MYGVLVIGTLANQKFIGKEGYNASGSRSIELWTPDSPNQSCILPDYPRRLERTATLNFVSGRLIACGSESCDVYQNNMWVHLQDTLQYRGGHHSSLSLSDAVLLIGGTATDGTWDTELIPADGSSPSPGPFKSRLLHGHDHCSIQMSEDTFIMTGGSNSERVVTKYTMNGENEFLPVLHQGRSNHACGSYRQGDNQVSFLFYPVFFVSSHVCFYIIWPFFSCSILFDPFI